MRRLFGVYDEGLHAQAKLDTTVQSDSESFAAFLVRFEDASLLTGYNEHALKWRLVAQINNGLRARITYIGGVPELYRDVVQKLLEIDGARQAFADIGLSDNHEDSESQHEVEDAVEVYEPSSNHDSPGMDDNESNNDDDDDYD
ncbi:hypothetical protein V5O48_019637, partial [Marasmius crinis-equi]